MKFNTAALLKPVLRSLLQSPEFKSALLTALTEFLSNNMDTILDSIIESAGGEDDSDNAAS